MRLIRLFLFAFITVSFLFSHAQNSPAIVLDESFEEWAEVMDIANVGTSGNTTIKAINDEEWLYLYFETTDVLSIQNDRQIVLYLDTDNDPSTGLEINGIGAEVQVDFGIRRVIVELDGATITVGFRDIGLHLMPTVWSDKYEVAIDREVVVNGETLFSSDAIKLVIEDLSNQTISPTNGGASYSFGTYSFDPLPTYSINKLDEGHLRMMSHNVLFDNLFDPDRLQYFRRMYQTIQPDIIGFQEIYEHDPEEVADIVEQILPSSPGETWYASAVNDNTVVSRFPIKETHNANVFGNGAFLLDLSPNYQTEMLIINAHTPCCDNDAGRTNEIDAMMAFVRDAKDGSGVLELKDNTPIVIMGDMNLVGNPQQIQTLLDGDIQNEGTWGPDFTPDWDGGNFLDSQPLVTGWPMTLTHWSGGGSGRYSTGRLDAIMYSGSGLTLENNYTLYTRAMDSEELATYNLEEDDSEGASDHLPMVVDFTVTIEQEVDLGILDLRKNDADGLPERLGETVTVSGVVTVDEELGSNNAFIQNDLAGIAVFGSEFGELFTVGDSIEITGDVGEFQGQTQLTYEAATSSVRLLKTTDLPLPLTLSISDILNQDWDGIERLEGQLIRLIGATFLQTGTFEGNTTYQVSNGEQTLNVRIDGETGIEGLTIPTKLVSIVGVLGQFDTEAPYNEGYQILPRSRTDIEEIPDGILALRENEELGAPVKGGEVVTVSGVITASTTFGSNGPGFMQDDRAGLALSGNEILENLNVGDSVTIISSLGSFNGLTQLVYDEANTTITTHKTVELPEPTSVSTTNVISQDWDGFELLEGMLVSIEGVSFEETGQFAGGRNYTISDGVNNLTFRVDGDTDIVGLSIPESSGTVVGIISQFDNAAPFSEGYQLLPRSFEDLQFETPLGLLDKEALVLFPNPASEFITIESTGFIQSVNILDMNGKQVHSSQNIEASIISISIDDLDPGLYVCRMVVDDEEVVRKLVIN